jgi:hypothetical protein
MLVEYDQDQLRLAARYVLSIRSHSCDCESLIALVIVTYCACCQDVSWHECLPLRHGLEEIGNAENQVIGSRILA